MNKSKTKRKTRSDKFPLALHLTGQYRKKIEGKMHYFGKDKKQVLEQYLERKHASAGFSESGVDCPTVPVYNNPCTIRASVSLFGFIDCGALPWKQQ